MKKTILAAFCLLCLCSVPDAGSAAADGGPAAAPARLEKHIPPLEHPRGDRWPLLAWGNGPESLEELGQWVERGISPLFNSSGNPRLAAGANLERFAWMQARGVPLIILPQGHLQTLFRGQRAGGHLPPAGSLEENHDFTCPAIMYEPHRLAAHLDRFRAALEPLREHGVTPAAVFVDFETGAYLRNGAEDEARVRAALAEALKCPRCLERFGAGKLDTPEKYRDAVDAARAHAARTALVDPVAEIFPGCATGNFYAWPVNRAPREPGKYHAYGYEESGMNVMQPRRYLTAGWRGARDEAQADRVVLVDSLATFSPAAAVLREGEILVPWLGLTASRNAARERRGMPFPTPGGWAEAARHIMLRGAETICVFVTSAGPEADFPESYGNIPRREVGPWILVMEGLQAGYNDMLRFNDLLRHGRPLNLGHPEGTGDAAVWSGVATGEVALVRTIALGPETEETIVVFGREVTLPFENRGRFFLVTPDGAVSTPQGVIP